MLCTLLVCVVCAIIGLGISIYHMAQTKETPEIKEWTNDIPTWRNAAITDRVLTRFNLTDPVCCLSHMQICGYTDTAAHFDIYRLYYDGVFSLFEDSVIDEKVIYYHKADSIVFHNHYERKDQAFSISSNMTSNWMDSLLIDTITAVGIYTVENGLVKMPVKPEATAQLKERYMLMKQHFEEN